MVVALRHNLGVCVDIMERNYGKLWKIRHPASDLTRDTLNTVGRDSSVGTATRYGLDGPGFESRWGQDFPHPSRRARWPTQPPIQWVSGLSWR